MAVKDEICKELKKSTLREIEYQRQISELEKALELACVHAYDIDCMCYIPCGYQCLENENEYTPEKCMTAYFKSKAKEALKNE